MYEVFQNSCNISFVLHKISHIMKAQGKWATHKRNFEGIRGVINSYNPLIFCLCMIGLNVSHD